MQEQSETWMSNLCKQIWKVNILRISVVLKSLFMLKWKSLFMLKCESVSVHAVQYKLQPGSVLIFCPYYFKNG